MSCINYRKLNFVALAFFFMSAPVFMFPRSVFSQEPMIGDQNGTTWKGLTIGTQAETTTRKTFYVDGLYNMSVFWSQHAALRQGSVDYNQAFLGLNVGQIRDCLDSLYSDARNSQIPIIDGVLIARLENAGVPNGRVAKVIEGFRRATINGINPAQENKIWKEGLFLLE